MPAYGRRKNHGRLETIPGFLPAARIDQPAAACSPIAARNATDRCRREAPAAARSRRPRVALLLSGARAELAAPAPHPRRPAVRRHRPAAAAARHNARAAPLLRTRNLSKTYQVAGKPLQAVHEVTLDLWPGETLGLVGESGSGKSSLAKLLLGLSAPDAGSRVDLARRGAAGAAPTIARRRQLKALQMVFQNPGSALNRSQTVRRLIGRSLRLVGLVGRAREARLEELAASVRLDAAGISTRSRVSSPAA